jgi:hypothetical protein
VANVKHIDFKDFFIYKGTLSNLVPRVRYEVAHYPQDTPLWSSNDEIYLLIYINTDIPAKAAPATPRPANINVV